MQSFINVTVKQLNSPVSCKAQRMLQCLSEVVQYPLEALKCTETYGIQNNYHHRCSNCTESLTYKNKIMKYVTLSHLRSKGNAIA